MPGVYVGDTKSLVFPVMCDGYLKQEYLEYNNASINGDPPLEVRGGIWGHQTFTVEAIITPYDVNGFGTHTGSGIGLVTSEKTPPSLSEAITSNLSHYESYKYFGTNRLTKKMQIFYNKNFQLYLENTATSNINRPAEYKLVAGITHGTPSTVETPLIVSGNQTLHGYYDSDGLYEGNTTNLRQVATNALNALPSNTITIASNSLNTDTAATAATATVAFSGGDPEAYWSATGSTATITGQNNFPTSELDTMPVREKGIIKFNGQPNVASNTSTDCIAITNESGSETIKLFFQGSGTNGDALSSPFPSDSYLVRPEATLVLTARNIVSAISGVSNFWAGNLDYGSTEPSTVVGEDDFRIIELKSAFTGSAPNRVGDTSASIVDGGAFISNNSDFVIQQFAGGINEDEKADFYISINDGSNTKKYTPFRDIANTASPDVNYPATGATYTKSGGTTVVAFRRKATLDATMNELLAAINNNTNGQGSALTASYNSTSNVLTITKDTAGTSGDASGAITKTNIADTRVTIGNSGNFANGRDVSEPNKYVELRDKSNNLLKFHGVRQDYDPTINTGDTFSYGGNSYIAFRLPYGTVSGSTQLTLFRQAVNTKTDSTNFDMSMSNNVITAGTVGTVGNGTNTENLSNTTVTNFTGGSAATTITQSVDITSADNVTVKYKPATLGSQTTASSDGTYTFFQIGGDTTATANNLITAINDTTNGHGSKITASNPSSNNVVKIQIETLGSSKNITDNYANITYGTWTTGDDFNISNVTCTNLGVGESLYDDAGTLIGTIASDADLTGTTVKLAALPATLVTSKIYASQPREAFYSSAAMNIACTITEDGIVQLYVNNKLMVTQKVVMNDNNYTKFRLDPSNCYIGQKVTHNIDFLGGHTEIGDSNTQFMGEILEICATNRKEPTVSNSTLSPGYSDIIFYYRFGED